MLVQVPDILSANEAAEALAALQAADWTDGRVTAGHQSAQVKQNLQIAEGTPLHARLGELVLNGLGRSPLFISAVLPLRVFPPLFNRYGGGQTFGVHIDNSIRQSREGTVRIRSDLSATLFLSEPEDYDGGELIVEEMYGPQSVKLPAGDMVLYPSKSLHRVTPVTRGARVSSFMWMQSLVRDDADRETLFRLDVATQRVATEKGPKDQAVIELTGVYHNLLRRWTEV